MLHLAFGLGEDWNTTYVKGTKGIEELHLAFGLGEDWNSLVFCPCVVVT